VSGAERDAEAVYRAALNHRTRVRGAGHPAALAAANNLAVLLASASSVRAGAGDRSGAAAAAVEAESLHRRVLAHRLAADPASLEVAATHFNLGSLLARWPVAGGGPGGGAAPPHRLNEAARFLRAAAAGREAVLGLHHPLVWDAWAAQVPVLSELGRGGVEAASLANAVFEARRAAAGRPPPGMAGLDSPAAAAPSQLAASLAYAHAAATLATLHIDAWAAAAMVGIVPPTGPAPLAPAAELVRAALSHVGWAADAGLAPPGASAFSSPSSAGGLPDWAALSAAHVAFKTAVPGLCTAGSGSSPSPPASPALHLARAALALAAGRCCLADDPAGSDVAGRAGQALTYAADVRAALLGPASPPALAARAAHMEWAARCPDTSPAGAAVVSGAGRQAALAGLLVGAGAGSGGGGAPSAAAAAAAAALAAPPEALLLGAALALAHAARGAGTAAVSHATPIAEAWSTARLEAANQDRAAALPATTRRAAATAHLALLPSILEGWAHVVTGRPVKAARSCELLNALWARPDAAVLCARLALRPTAPALGPMPCWALGSDGTGGPASVFGQFGDPPQRWTVSYLAAHLHFLAWALMAGGVGHKLASPQHEYVAGIILEGFGRQGDRPALQFTQAMTARVGQVLAQRVGG